MSIRDIYTSISDGVNREILPDSYAGFERAIMQFEREDAVRNNLKEVQVEVKNVRDRGDTVIADIARTAEGAGRVESKDKVYGRAVLEALKEKPKKPRPKPVAENKTMVEGLYSFIRGDVDNDKLGEDYKKASEGTKRPQLAVGDLVERTDRSRIYGRVSKMISESEVVVHWSDGDKPIKTEEPASVLELVKRPETVEDREDNTNSDVDKISTIMKFDPPLIVAAIKDLGEEDIAGFSDVTEDDLLDILKSLEDHELEEILGVLNKSNEAKFGSVEWQDEQIAKIKAKLESGEELDGADEAFIETQREHNKRAEIEELDRMWKASKSKAAEARIIERAKLHGYSTLFGLEEQSVIDEKLKVATESGDVQGIAVVSTLKINREAYDRAKRELGLLDIGKISEKQYAYSVFLDGKEIDTVFYSGEQEVEDVKRSLVDHDGYDSRIEVKLAESGVKPEEFTRLGEAESTDQHKAVAQEIAKQLGGTGRLKAMIGAKNFGYDAGVGMGRLSFKFMRGKDGINSISVTLNGMDTYDLKFMNPSGKAVKELEGVYAEDLRRIFSDTTGLALSLGTVGGESRTNELKPANPFGDVSVLTPEEKKRLSDIVARADKGGEDISDKDIEFAEQCANKMRRNRHMGERKWAYEMDLSFLGPYVADDKKPGDDDSRELIDKIVAEMKKFMSLNESLPEDAMSELEQLVAEFESVTTAEDFDYALRELYALGDDFDIWIKTNPDQESSESKSNGQMSIEEFVLEGARDTIKALAKKAGKPVQKAYQYGKEAMNAYMKSKKKKKTELKGKDWSYIIGVVKKRLGLPTKAAESRIKEEVDQDPKSPAQKIFVDAVNAYNKTVLQQGEEADVDFSGQQLTHFTFHDDKSVATDATIYDILTHGQSDYGVGKEFREKLDAELKNAGYYLEAEGGGVFNFVKESKVSEGVEVERIPAKGGGEIIISKFASGYEAKHVNDDGFTLDSFHAKGANPWQEVLKWAHERGAEGAKESKVSEQDKYVIISRGIVDKAEADRLAVSKKGRVIIDDQDEKKFMVVVGEAVGKGTEWKCQECGKKFRRVAPKSGQMKCPKCGSYDIDIAEAVDYTPVTDDTKFDVTDEVVDSTASELGINFDEVNREEFKKGLGVEQEHADVTKGDPVATAKIALAHIKELPNYYTRLARMEQAGESVIRTAAGLKKFLKKGK